MRYLWVTCTASLLLTTAACDSEPKCGEPLYAGKATDEAWRALTDARKQSSDSSRAVTLLSPDEGEVYPADAPAPHWQWSSPLRASLERAGPPARTLAAAPRRGRSLAAWVESLVLPRAHAHMPPYTGDLYLLEVAVPGRECPVQVLTSELEWQLDEASWATLGEAAGQPLQLQVTSAYLLQDRVTEGPYQLGTPRTFRRATTP